MKRLYTGVILLDRIDIICISFSLGCSIACLVKSNKKRKLRRGEDPIITELKNKSPIIVCSKTGKPIKLPLVRGGDNDNIKDIPKISVMIKNKKLIQLIGDIINAKKHQKELKLLSDFFFMLNNLLTISSGLRIAVGGSMSLTEIVLLGFPSTVGGFVLGLLITQPIIGVLIPLAILTGRGIEDIPNNLKKCKQFCEAAAKYHNKQFMLEMKNHKLLLEDLATQIQLPINEVPLVCVEQPLSLYQRYQLKSLIKGVQSQKQVQFFNEFIKKFPECDVDSEILYEASRNIAEQIKVRK